MQRYDLISGFVLGGFALLFIFVWIPQETEPGYDLALQPSLPPTVLAVAILVLALFLMARSLKRPMTRELEAPIKAEHWVSLFTFTLILIAGYWIFKLFGFWPGGAFLVLAFLLHMGERNKWIVLATTLASPTAIYLFFWQILKIQLP